VLGDWAYMWSRLTVVVTPPAAQATTRTGYALSIFKKQGGKWLLARDANMLAPVRKPRSPRPGPEFFQERRRCAGA
jgi:ketosteroid isomerase-like protein